MLESATVTLKYSEFQDLVEKNKKIDYLEKVLKDKEDTKEAILVDKIIDILVKAYESNDIEEKQQYLLNGIEDYCEIFNIPLKELLECNT